MIKVSSDAHRVLVAKIQEAGQSQVFSHWERLSPEEQGSLLDQLQTVDLSLVRKLNTLYLQGTQEKQHSRLLNATPLLRSSARQEDLAREAEAREAGEAILRKGQVAVLTAAGGITGTSEFGRPGGTVPFGPVSGKSLFCLHAEKIRALSRRHRSALPWIIVTSLSNHDATCAHFKEADYFGLKSSEVIFLSQDELPVVNRRGKILLAEPGRIATSPNGHGGIILKLLNDEKAFRSLEMREIKQLFYFQVDNPLTRIADPVFLGHHVLRGSDLSSKTVYKVDPEEKVGIFCQVNGALGVVEYGEVDEKDRTRREPGGQLELAAGNIAIHVFSMDFLRGMRSDGVQLPYHILERATPTIDRKGTPVVPSQPNSIAFECFIFDALPFAKSTLVMETQREEEFSPVKNESGNNSLVTAQRDLSRMYARWLEAAGAQVTCKDGVDCGPIEISPLYALDAEELKEKLETPVNVTAGFYLGK